LAKGGRMSAQFELLILLSYGEKENMIALGEKLESLMGRFTRISLICSDDEKVVEYCQPLGEIIFCQLETSEYLNEKKESFNPTKIQGLFQKKDDQAMKVVIMVTHRDTVVKIARKYLYDYFAKDDEEKLSRLEPGQGLVVARTGTVWSLKPYFPDSRPRQH